MTESTLYALLLGTWFAIALLVSLVAWRGPSARPARARAGTPSTHVPKPSRFLRALTRP